MESNADRIRAMTDEDLAIFFDQMASCCIGCAEEAEHTDCPICCGGRYCSSSDILMWLRQPVNESGALHKRELED